MAAGRQRRPSWPRPGPASIRYQSTLDHQAVRALAWTSAESQRTSLEPVLHRARPQFVRTLLTVAAFACLTCALMLSRSAEEAHYHRLFIELLPDAAAMEPLVGRWLPTTA